MAKIIDGNRITKCLKGLLVSERSTLVRVLFLTAALMTLISFGRSAFDMDRYGGIDVWTRVYGVRALSQVGDPYFYLQDASTPDVPVAVVCATIPSA